MDRLNELAERLRIFVEERDWEQFHSPKNLAMALTVEAAELPEVIQWMTEAERRNLSEAQPQAVAEELADVLLYALRLSKVIKIDLLAAGMNKLEKNRVK